MYLNADKLIQNIRKNVGKFETIEKDELRYEVNIVFKGFNGKTENVKTKWIIDASMYVK